jgi:nitroreductase
MASAIETINNRRSIRKFKNETVPQELIDKVIDAGLHAPSARNMQDSIILQIKDPSVREEITRTNCSIGGWNEGHDPFYGAPVILVVLGLKSWPPHVYDGSLVLGNMMIAATELGLGSCWIHRAKEEFQMEKFKKLLLDKGIEEEYEGIGHLILGFPEIAGKPVEIQSNRVFTI